MVEAGGGHPPGSNERTPRRRRELRTRRAVAFAIAFALPLSLAFQGGGYDLVARQEVGLVLWMLIALGFAFDLLPRGVPTRAAQLALLALVGLACFTALALAWTESDERTFEEVARVVGYAGYATLAYAALSRYTARAAAAGLATAALAVPLFSLTARLAPELITDDAVRLLSVDRLSYPLGYWNALACWCSIAIAIGLVWSAHARTPIIRALALAAVPAAGLAVYLTYSRAGAITVAVAVLAAIAVSRHRWTVAAGALAAGAASGAAILVLRDQPEIARATGDAGAGVVVAALIVGALGCAGVALATARFDIDRIRLAPQLARPAVALGILVVLLGSATAGRGPIEDAWDEFSNERAPTASEDPAARLSSFGGNRDDVWASALDAFASDRARGVGPGAFEFWWAREGEDAFLRDGHSLYFEQLAELGLVGLLLVLAVFGCALAAAVQARVTLTRDADAGAVAALIAGFAVFAVYAGVDWVWEIPALVALGLGGIAVAGAASFDRRGQPRLPPLARLAAIALAVVAFAVQIPSLVSTERLRASADALRASDNSRALELANESVDAAPFAASGYVQRALVHEARGEFAEARVDFGDAIERESTNWRHRLLLARVLARDGNRAGARAQLRAARRLSPDNLYLLPGSTFLREIEALLDRSG